MTTLKWHDLDRLGKTNNQGIWIPHARFAEYFDNLDIPSAKNPHVYARGAMTKMFASWLIENFPKDAKRVGFDVAFYS